ncbi:hypothetical protein Trydic_g495 [Trypoxylus dichotomus]
MKAALVVIFLCFGVCPSFGRKLPSFVTKCKLKDPEVVSCVKNRIEEYQKYIIDGVKEFHIPNLNPYVVPQVNIQLSWMNSTFTNVEVYSINNYTIDNFDMDFDEGFLKVRMSHKSVSMKGPYEMDGKLSQLNFHGEGEMENDNSGIVGDITVNGKKVTRHGKEYFEMDSATYKFASYKVDRVYFSNLFANNAELTERVNKIINENSDELFADTYPAVEKIIDALVVNIIKATFGRYSLDELFD